MCAIGLVEKRERRRPVEGGSRSGRSQRRKAPEMNSNGDITDSHVTTPLFTKSISHTDRPKK